MTDSETLSLNVDNVAISTLLSEENSNGNKQMKVTHTSTSLGLPTFTFPNEMNEPLNDMIANSDIGNFMQGMKDSISMKAKDIF